MKKNGLHPVPRQCQFQLEALRSFDSLRKNITCFCLVAYLDSDTFVLKAMLLQNWFWLMLFNEWSLWGNSEMFQIIDLKLNHHCSSWKTMCLVFKYSKEFFLGSNRIVLLMLSIVCILYFQLAKKYTLWVILVLEVLICLGVKIEVFTFKVVTFRST